MTPDADPGRMWPAPAKLNLFLHVVGRRDDGYHELQTLFQFLEFGDELGFEVRRDGAIRRATDVPGVPEDADLAVRAARLLRSETGCTLGCDIRLEKRIPLGGGLGGGSSDAATTLIALNRLWDLGLDDARLSALGLRLGADVPVFVHGHAAWAEGVGERLTPVHPPEAWYLVVTPECAVSTREVFAAPDLPRDSPRVSYPDYAQGRVRNDLAAVARGMYPEVGAALDWLGARAPARLSGSGASVFAAFAEATAAEQLRRQVPDSWRSVVTRGRNVSPLRVALQGHRVP